MIGPGGFMAYPKRTNSQCLCRNPERVDGGCPSCNPKFWSQPCDDEAYEDDQSDDKSEEE